MQTFLDTLSINESYARPSAYASTYPKKWAINQCAACDTWTHVKIRDLKILNAFVLRPEPAVTDEDWPVRVWSHGTHSTDHYVKFVFQVPTEKPSKVLRDMLRRRSAPAVVGRRSPLEPTGDPRELMARDTLRSFIGQDRWQRFMRDGFISVHSHVDHKTYQIFPGHDYNNITRVYDKGVMVERLCCYLSGGFPPTDHLLMRFLLVLNSPGEFRRLCVVHQALSPVGGGSLAPHGLDIVAEFRRLKQKAA